MGRELRLFCLICTHKGTTSYLLAYLVTSNLTSNHCPWVHQVIFWASSKSFCWRLITMAALCPSGGGLVPRFAGGLAVETAVALCPSGGGLFAGFAGGLAVETAVALCPSGGGLFAGFAGGFAVALCPSGGGLFAGFAGGLAVKTSVALCSSCGGLSVGGSAGGLAAACGDGGGSCPFSTYSINCSFTLIHS